MFLSKAASCAVIVAHPDDETLWASGTIMQHPDIEWTVITACRRSDQDRSAKFFQALEILGASGVMGDLDDDPEQSPISKNEIQQTILSLLPKDVFDIVFTHGLWGEYTRHLRHEEISKAVTDLWNGERLYAKQIWRFAYEDGGGSYLPRAVRDADVWMRLPEEVWQRKYDLITQVYGFDPESFEVRATPREEAFWCSQKRRTMVNRRI